MNRRYPLLVCVLTYAIILIGAPSLAAPLYAETPPRSSVATPGGEESAARTAFNQGKALLEQNKADQAFGYLESALRLFTEAGDREGQAVTHDALGDIYSRQGQYAIALDNYRSALAAFRAVNELYGANLVLSKIGETYFLMGDAADARAAFAQMIEKKSDQVGSIAGGERNTDNSDTSSSKKEDYAFAAFAASGSALSGLSCSERRNNNNNPNNNPARNEPPFQGHSPQTPGGSGRMDLRVFDQNGNPVKGVEAKLVSKGAKGLPKGFVCDCKKVTDASGRALMDPLHIGDLKLTLKAPGYQPQEISVTAEELDRPVRVTLQAKEGAQVKTAATGGNNAAQLRNPLNDANAAATCLDLYRLFNIFTIAQLGMGRADYSNNQLDSARRHFESALTAADASSPIGNLAQAGIVRAVTRTALGDISYRQSRFSDAIKLYTEAIEGARQDGRLNLLWAAQRGIGRSLWALSAFQPDPQKAAKFREDAISAYRDALRTIETLLAGSLRADEGRTTFLATTSDVFNEASSMLAEMALTGKGSTSAPLSGQALTYAAEGFKIVEQGRARSLLDLLGESRIGITEGIAPDLLKRRADNLARQQEIAELLTGVDLAGQKPTQPIEALEKELDRLSTEYEGLENQIRSSNPRYATLTKTEPLGLSEVQQQVLDGGTALLEYSVGDQASYLWAITQNSVGLYKLPPRAALDFDVTHLRSLIIPAAARRAITGIDTPAEVQRGLGLDAAAPPPPEKAAAFASAAQALYKTIVAPAASIVGNKRLLVVADGALNYIPFEALVKTPGGTDYADLDYLVKSNEIVYALSASVIAAARREDAKRNASNSILVVADPVFDADDPRAKDVAKSTPEADETFRGLALGSALADVAGDSKGIKIKLNRLYGTRTEAEQIAQLARSSGKTADLWLDFNASAANVEQREINQYRVLHFATHGLLDAERPQFTGLVLSLVGNHEGDGFLRAEKIFNLHLGSPLVMLSACETGLGKEVRGEGVIGLTRAFMYAGAPTVGVSLWSVSDRSTAELMPDFYKRLLGGGGASAATALRAAQQDLIAGKRYSAPFYWAPFVLVGDWN